jgi:hypothetical protein
MDFPAQSIDIDSENLLDVSIVRANRRVGVQITTRDAPTITLWGAAGSRLSALKKLFIDALDALRLEEQRRFGVRKRPGR